jgi:LysR family transcriptional regulator (chromosome initiation inhibitor)
MTLLTKNVLALAKVIELESFERAASELYVTQSAVSQRIKQLEQQLGQTLVLRSQPPKATHAGQRLMHFYQQAQLLEDEFHRTSRAQKLTLNIAINADSLDTWWLPATTKFVGEHGLVLDTHKEDQDKTLDLLRRGEVVAAISAQAEPLAGCESQYLGTVIYHCMCTEQFRQQYFATGVNAENFRHAPSVHFNPKDQLQRNYLAKHWNIQQLLGPQHQMPTSQSYSGLILANLAWGMMPQQQFQPFVETGQLIKLTPTRPVKVPLYWHTWTVKSELLRSFGHHLRQHCETHLD